MQAGDKDHLEEWLDEALQQYGNAEPRAGLESRILTNLAAEEPRWFYQGWRWALVGASLTILLTTIWFGIESRVPKTNEHALVPVQSQNAPNQPEVTSPSASNQSSRQSRRNQAHAFTNAHLRKPRLDQFPSPRPASEEELILAKYVERFPKEAMLISQEQRKFELEIREAEKQAQSTETESEQEER